MENVPFKLSGVQAEVDKGRSSATRYNVNQLVGLRGSIYQL